MYEVRSALKSGEEICRPFDESYDAWKAYYRLQNLLTGAKAQVDESIEDTIRDVIGYALLELAYRRKKTEGLS